VIIDSHCHIDTAGFDEDRSEVLERAAKAGISTMIVIGAGAGLADCDRALALVREHDQLRATVGVHPHHASTCDAATLAGVAERARDPQVVAIGETGLDYYYDTSPQDVQREAFRRFVQMGRERALPLILHIRDGEGSRPLPDLGPGGRGAHEDAKAILREEGASEVGGVVHCFTGTPQDAEDYLALGFHLGITGIVTFGRAGDLPEVVASAPLDRLLVETDSPFLAPHPHRGKRNEPAHVARVVERIAAIRGTSVAAIAAATTDNANRLFSLTS